MTGSSSELNIWLLDDGTLAGTAESLSADPTLVKELEELRGTSPLPVRNARSITSTPEIMDSLSVILPGASVLKPKGIFPLGALMGSKSIDVIILSEKVEGSKMMEDRINTIDAHDILFLHTRYLSLP